MGMNITLEKELYDRVVERARAEGMTPDEWLGETGRYGCSWCKGADVGVEITNYRLGR
jgi:hypothetical protein